MAAGELASRSIGLRVLLIVASAVGLLVTATGPALASFPAHQPDLLLGTYATCCAGLGIHESWPKTQQFDAPVEQGGYANYYVLIQNGGTETDTYRVIGEGSYSGVHVRYFTGSGREITSAVVGGRYILSNFGPSRHDSIGIRLSAPAAPIGFERSLRVIARSLVLPGAMDAVSFRVTVTK